MTFYVSLSGLKGAQADLSAISNNVANVNSTAFKKSKAQFGDIFAASPMQTTHQVAGQGVRVQGITQQFTQGTIETTDKTLDLAITGEGFFTVKGEDGTISYTRNGAFLTFEENIKGTLEPGMLADFVILSQDILSVPAEKIRRTAVEKTYVGGKLVYDDSKSEL